MTGGTQEAGRVWAHVGQAFAEWEYDVVVVGAGRMGTACALFLRRLAPGLRLLLVERGGLPNEEGATILAPGVWTALDVPPGREREAAWVRAALERDFGDVTFQTRALLELHAGEGEGHVPTADLLAHFPEAAGLLDPAALPWTRLDGEAATYRPGAVALACGQGAVRVGADLLLNTHAHLTPGGVRLDRLTVTNTHQIVTHETHELRAGVVVVAMGADGPHAAEHDLGVHTAHGRAYRQTPRLNTASSDRTPLLRAGGLTLRPQHGGFTLIPPIHHRDPHGYLPGGGRLTGVPVGVRRETLEDLIRLMDALPPLATEALEVGHSLADVPGAWLALPGGRTETPPVHQRLTDGVHLLLGGPLADTLGLAVASDLAAQIAGVRERPWE
ncbi:FAD dependent oxidoreductase [Deinococcus phoenicis]|uniref:FAD dependent oxidoreductase n=2 Tax=Deinococcus phoenicis TaxID=1476583 RepID=A0A016QQL5_9DEIO|nr:FAD-dependent oxidoreductase [Deinococcus phoenicis]EYB68435.1 FAD dependent oxidoreductase [Deinococcus phoenicis]